MEVSSTRAQGAFSGLRLFSRSYGNSPHFPATTSAFVTVSDDASVYVEQSKDLHNRDSFEQTLVGLENQAKHAQLQFSPENATSSASHKPKPHVSFLRACLTNKDSVKYLVICFDKHLTFRERLRQTLHEVWRRVNQIKRVALLVWHFTLHYPPSLQGNHHPHLLLRNPSPGVCPSLQAVEPAGIANTPTRSTMYHGNTSQHLDGSHTLFNYDRRIWKKSTD